MELSKEKTEKIRDGDIYKDVFKLFYVIIKYLPIDRGHHKMSANCHKLDVVNSL